MQFYDYKRKYFLFCLIYLVNIIILLITNK